MDTSLPAILVLGFLLGIRHAMDADHVAAWSKGGDSDLKNCQMLCVPHNRAKGNK